MDLASPTTWDEYRKQVEFFTRDTDGDGKRDFYGTINQGQRGDCICMQWSNYLYANGGQYHDANWKATFNSEAGLKAVEDFKNDIAKHGPTGSESFCFDEAINVLAQGKAYSFVTFNILLSGFDDPASSQVVGKAEIAPNPDRRPEWRLGLGHPELEPEQGRGLDVHQVGRVQGHREEARAGRRRADPGLGVRRSGCGGQASLHGQAEDPGGDGAGIPDLHLHGGFRGSAGPRAQSRGHRPEGPQGSAGLAAAELDELAKKDGY